MIAEIVATFLELLTAMVKAGEDKIAQQEALMAAEEKLVQARARARFG